MTRSNERKPHANAPTDEFYIGYAPPMPPRLSRFVTGVVAVAGTGVIAGSVVLALGHRPLEGGSFAFGERHTMTGVVIEHPYPAIRPEDGAAARDWTLLVAPGKHGAASLMRGLNGARVRLEGARIQRDGRTMLEVIPDSVARMSLSDRVDATSTDDGEQPASVTLRGEIVDSKCFLGVMVPGAGKTHRECAALCLRGGIPPALFVRDLDGRSTLLLLENESGQPIGHRAVELAGTRVEITGTRGLRGEWPTLRSDPATWTPLQRTAMGR